MDKQRIARELVAVARSLVAVVDKDAMEWAKNLASRGTPRADIIDAAEDMGLDWREVDIRYLHAGGRDLVNPKAVYFILTGERYPGAGGYTWASKLAKTYPEILTDPAKNRMLWRAMSKIES